MVSFIIKSVLAFIIFIISLIIDSPKHLKVLFLVAAITLTVGAYIFYGIEAKTLTTAKIKEPCITEDGYGIYYKQSDAVLSKMGNSSIALDPNSDSEWLYVELDADKVTIQKDLTNFDSSYIRLWSYSWHDKEDIYYEIHIPKNMTLTELPQQ